MSTAFAYQSEPQKPYYDMGHYKKEITRVGLNKWNDPVVTFKVTTSHDGRRVNSYRTINFFMSEKSSPASRDLWKRKFNELVLACGLTKIEDLEEMLGKTITVAYPQSGFEPLPNFSPEKLYNPNWQSKQSQNAGRLKQEFKRYQVPGTPPPIENDPTLPPPGTNDEPNF